jgi:gliding motility-associated-like protein
MFSCSSLIYNGQIVIHEGTNIIETHIGNLPNCSSWNSGNSVHGLHDETGTQAYTVTGRNNANYTVTNEARAFIPSGSGGVAWFDINGNLLGTGTSITVFPQSTTQYIVSAVCGTSFNPAIADTVTVSIGSVGLNFESFDEDCWQSDNGMAVVNLPNANTWDVEWFDVFGNSLQINGGVSGSDTLKGLEAGAYFVQLFDQTNNCSVIDTVFINQPPPIIQNAQIENSFCGQNNGSIDLNLADGFGQLTWTWDDGAPTLDRDNLPPGTYVLTVTDSIGCDTSQSFIVDEENPVDADFDANPPSGLLPLNVQFTNLSTGGTTYSWDFGDGGTSTQENPSYIYDSDGTFEVVLTVTDELTGCTDVSRFTIRVDSEPRLSMPNVFTPGSLFPYFNAITNNDSTANIVEFEGVIYNRWGSVIFTWSDWANMSSGWDGTAGGGNAPEGTYYYFVKARGNNNEVIEEAGHFMLLR